MSENPSSRNWQNILWSTLMTILGVACFPANPLVLTGVIEVKSYLVLFIIGWVVWALGMVLVMAPIVMFPRRGGVTKGKSFVNTTRLVDTGIYAVVRHPQYTGGVYALFLTTFLWYPHWLFGVLGAIGTAAVYMGCREEDQRLIEKFGDAYVGYMKRVPRMERLFGPLPLAEAQKTELAVLSYRSGDKEAMMWRRWSGGSGHDFWGKQIYGCRLEFLPQQGQLWFVYPDSSFLASDWHIKHL